MAVTERIGAYNRRSFLGSLGAALLTPTAARGQAPLNLRDHGLMKPPLPAPDIGLLCHDGRRASLPALVAGQVTALQLMFTSCKATCPIQGAIFAQVQKLLGRELGRGIQLLSLSVDPEHDAPPVLKQWLRRFKGQPAWVAAAPAVSDVERLRDFAGRGRNPSDNHATRVQIVGRQGAVVWRTGEFPPAEEVALLLRRFSAI